MDNNCKAFFALLRAGLWEQGVRLLPYEPLDFEALYKLADEQSVVGLVAAGLEHVEDRKVTKPEAVAFLKKVFSLEGRNQEMNRFIRSVYGKMRAEGIQSVLVKGQGVGQCYLRPLWRSVGDVDLLLDAEQYEKAKAFFTPMASFIDKEDHRRKHLGMTIDSWTVELHGTFHGNVSKHADAIVDHVQKDTLSLGSVRVWNNDTTDIFLPAPNNDVIFIFSHIQQHLFRGGIGLRQICDFCRLLWTFRDSINVSLLRSRIQKMRMMTEWKAFAAFLVDYLGMPVEAMPLYDTSSLWKRKARRICSFVLRVGNFGHNRDSGIYERYPYLIYKTISLGRHIGDFCDLLFIFPLDALRVFVRMLFVGAKAVSKGE